MEGAHSAAEQSKAKVEKEERQGGPALTADECPKQLLKWPNRQ